MAKQDEKRVCPTRVDGADALFAHKVTADKCHDRQRARYHKCYACVFNRETMGSAGSKPAKVAAAAE